MKGFRCLIMVALFLLCFMTNISFSTVIIKDCNDCHVIYSANGTEIGGVEPLLLNSSCIKCHTGTNKPSGTTPTTPYVLDDNKPVYGVNTLAGGNFWWVSEGDDTKGHNVLGISNPDMYLGEAPGNLVMNCNESCHTSLAEDYSDIGGNGCKGCHLNVRHHATDAEAGTVTSKENGWFRFLSGHMSGESYGVEGIEDSDWEFTKAPDDHNEYLGKTGNKSLEDNSMTSYCCGCHKEFHSSGSAVWLRHPSDSVIPNRGEYRNYTEYSVEAPVARPDLSDYEGPSDIVKPGTDMVMCLSCHRAHGSPYPDMLRWDYSAQFAGGGGEDNTGCFTCHTQKDN